MSTEATSRQRSWPVIFTIAAVVACLYLGREFLLPIALATLLSFLLAPLLRALERRGLKRIPAVLVVTGLAFLVIGFLIYIVTSQLLDFAADLQKYRSNLLEKVAVLRKQSDGPLGRAVQTVQEVAAAAMPGKTEAGKPVPVEVVSGTNGTPQVVLAILNPLLSALGQAAVVVIVVIFMLLGYEDARDRIIHLIGRGHLRVTTEALDEAGNRVSRYLQAQLLINVLYGVPVAIALYFVGVPNAVLWGLLAIVLRFLPYIGPWIAAAFPIALSVAVSTGWTQFALVVGLFVVMEVVSNNVIEPWLYGASTGLSPLAVILSALFWAWLWGGIGLVIATPLTVCLAVAGKHVKGLAFLDVLVGDKPPIPRSERLFQRLLALDEEESCQIVEKAIEEHDFVWAADHVLLPAVRTFEADVHAGQLPEKTRAGGFQLMREVIAEVSTTEKTPEPQVLCLAALNDADEIAALALSEALRLRAVAATVASSKLLIAETLEQAVAANVPIICIVSVPPLSVLVASNLCQRLRERLPDTRLPVVLWQDEDDEFSRRRERLKRRGAYDVFPSIEAAVRTITQLAGCEPAQ